MSLLENLHQSRNPRMIWIHIFLSEAKACWTFIPSFLVFEFFPGLNTFMNNIMIWIPPWILILFKYFSESWNDLNPKSRWCSILHCAFGFSFFSHWCSYHVSVLGVGLFQNREIKRWIDNTWSNCEILYISLFRPEIFLSVNFNYWMI